MKGRLSHFGRMLGSWYIILKISKIFWKGLHVSIICGGAILSICFHRNFVEQSNYRDYYTKVVHADVDFS